MMRRFVSRGRLFRNSQAVIFQILKDGRSFQGERCFRSCLKAVCRFKDLFYAVIVVDIVSQNILRFDFYFIDRADHSLQFSHGRTAVVFKKKDFMLGRGEDKILITHACRGLFQKLRISNDGIPVYLRLISRDIESRTERRRRDHAPWRPGRGSGSLYGWP